MSCIELTLSVALICIASGNVESIGVHVWHTPSSYNIKLYAIKLRYQFIKYVIDAEYIWFLSPNPVIAIGATPNDDASTAIPLSGNT